MTVQDKARRLRPLIEKAAASLPDGDALEAVELFPHYAVGVDYRASDRFFWEGKLYKVLQDHTSAEEWAPNTATSLYVEVTPPGVIPVWKQPTGSADAYMMGDKVHYPDEDGPVYESKMDYNVYSPEAYPDGWALVGY